MQTKINNDWSSDIPRLMALNQENLDAIRNFEKSLPIGLASLKDTEIKRPDDLYKLTFQLEDTDIFTDANLEFINSLLREATNFTKSQQMSGCILGFSMKNGKTALSIRFPHVNAGEDI